MAKKDGRRYTDKFKFQVILEALRSQKPDAEVARAYQVHSITLSKWKKEFLEKGAEVFGGGEEVRASEQKISKLERMVGTEGSGAGASLHPVGRGRGHLRFQITRKPASPPHRISLLSRWNTP